MSHDPSRRRRERGCELAMMAAIVVIVVVACLWLAHRRQAEDGPRGFGAPSLPEATQ